MVRLNYHVRHLNTERTDLTNARFVSAPAPVKGKGANFVNGSPGGFGAVNGSPGGLGVDSK